MIAATNHPGILDPALFRRFDDILHYELPDRFQIAQLLKTRLSSAAVKGIRWRTLADIRTMLKERQTIADKLAARGV